eukprot:Skav208049  [mRNA]  locus=scaffold1124:62022:73341:- [translate_table: standard]
MIIGLCPFQHPESRGFSQASDDVVLTVASDLALQVCKPGHMRAASTGECSSLSSTSSDLLQFRDIKQQQQLRPRSALSSPIHTLKVFETFPVAWNSSDFLSPWSRAMEGSDWGWELGQQSLDFTVASAARRPQRNDTMSRHPRRVSHGCLPAFCLVHLLGLLSLVTCGELGWLSFVQGSIACNGQRDSKRQLMERFSRRGRDAFVKDDARALSVERTLRIKNAKSAKQLVEVLDDILDGPFDFYQASSAYHSLATWKKRRELQSSDWDGPVIERLHARVQGLVLQDGLGARESANILWSFATLSDRFSIPAELLDALVKSMHAKAMGMNQQELSNCLWASAYLKNVAPLAVEMVRALSAQIIDTAKSMNPQGVSNCFWASAQLKDVAPEVLEVVPAIAAQIPDKVRDMIPQQLSNCLWASAQLKAVKPGVLKVVPAIVLQIPEKAKDMIPQHLSNCLWACAQLKELAPDVLEAVPALAAEIPEKANSMNLQQFCNTLIALLALQDSGLEVAPNLAWTAKELTKTAVARISSSIRKLTATSWRLDVPTIVWACARVGVYDAELLASVAQHLPSPKAMSSLTKFGLCALSWSYRVLDTQGDFRDFQQRLASAIAQRGLSEADVENSELWPLQ